ncbi:hypothetical protein LCGC14_1044350 [marine sediment metagenome]|uniref:DNA-directed DNA polymerase family A palm domain-containing protein n=1 Tax=marine sediment metagenome TaxID=412755 RepID=A0A0F9MV72_9ZZZZ
MTPDELQKFELALAQPCMAITARGLRIDEERRLSMIAVLEAEIAPLHDELQGIVLPLVAENEAKLKKLKKWHLFVEKWCCSCCRGGVKKAAACWSCAGFEKSPTKKMIGEYLKAEGIWYATDVLLPCLKCGGQGKGSKLLYKPSSDDQTKIVLYDLCRLPKRMLKKKLTVAEDKLKTLVAFDKRGIVPKLLKITKHATIVSILERMKPGPDGRLRTFLNPAGTETGRFSSAGGFLEPFSTNLQNLPKREAAKDPKYDVRRCVIPDEGCVLIEADLGQAEARVTAYLANDEPLIRRWEHASFDVHKWMASIAFEKEMSEVTKGEREYIGKTVSHAANYGTGAKTYMQAVNSESDVTGFTISLAFAERALASVHRARPALKKWWRRVDAALRSQGTLTTVWGRKRTFFGRRQGDGWLDHTHKEAIAFEPQSAVADVLNMGLLAYWDRFDGRLGTIMLQIHDAVLIQTETPKRAMAAQALKSCLTIPMKIGERELTIPVDVSWSERSWGEMEE